jgi:hypothetical protein
MQQAEQRQQENNQHPWTPGILLRGVSGVGRGALKRSANEEDNQ